MRNLFSWLRPPPGAEAASLYAALVRAARDPHWYREGKVPDTIEGRFGLLATLIALTVLRLESGGEEAVRGSVALTEAFIADMDAQMREEGFDAGLGKQVRSMVGALAARIDRWRFVADEDTPAERWREAARWSVFRDDEPDESALTYVSEQCRRFAERIGGEADAQLLRGEL
ncbi:ubiquinol-cytochrome C chaperone family protein [Sphingomicrobium astaxanthinifaciens]|uniref:ubiquinol-cytochrome C chaperone family protein n=1 Tax=Sphingomicrobium astaxanthinifaciens TaxID=1227949 RepID=UPI001FCAF734|nr:ubiquinol-cytochrome C chaperone family protein [Sphingomicrobium astaxanthinifaciens]MCJ7421128.1 ubiquinol-cytochrome C chaperone [Sphingomicrobium astaxanthinifaciens]